MFIKELDVKFSLRCRIRIIGVKRNLTENRRWKEGEGKNYEYEFECVEEHEHNQAGVTNFSDIRTKSAKELACIFCIT